MESKTQRLPELQAFLDAATPALLARATAEGSPASIRRILTAAETVGGQGADPSRLPVCDWFDVATDPLPEAPDLAALVRSLRALSGRMVWRTRAGDATASAGFADNHANAMLVGPGGIEDHRDIWIGLSLLAPHTRYPDHRHTPEETYLVLSPGQFRAGASDWFEPGMGGSFYNPPNILHAMRSGEAPLFALWALWLPHAS
jgi:quercetin dioxygenase-like cupin family protein